MKIELLTQGADEAPYTAIDSGPLGYKSVIDDFNMTKLINEGDVFMIDTGAQFDHYWSDFDRNFVVGNTAAGDEIRKAHDDLWNAT